MLKNLKKQQQGFTIIEVMIVLVIAAVILLIVFLAVPALQRNSRNTQRKSDVAGILAGANEAAGNNGGVYPTVVADVMANVKTGFYSTANVTLVTTVPGTNGTTDQTAIIVPNAKCAGSIASAATRQVAVLYTVEAGSGSTPMCQSS